MKNVNILVICFGLLWFISTIVGFFIVAAGPYHSSLGIGVMLFGTLVTCMTFFAIGVKENHKKIKQQRTE